LQGEVSKKPRRFLTCQRGGVVNARAWRARSFTGAKVRILSLALWDLQIPLNQRGLTVPGGAEPGGGSASDPFVGVMHL
jgi:hypothetical protein